MCTDEGDVLPVDAIEGLRGAGDDEIFDAHVVGEDAGHRLLENFWTGAHARRVENITVERRRTEQRPGGEDSRRADEDLAGGGGVDARRIIRGFGISRWRLI